MTTTMFSLFLISICICIYLLKEAMTTGLNLATWLAQFTPQTEAPLGICILTMTVHRRKVLIQVLALLAFIIQLAYAIEKFLSRPSMTNGASTSIYSLGSPIMIAMCRNVQFNYSNDLGYVHGSHYFRGKTVNSSFLSWTGMTGNFTANETFLSLFEPFTDKLDVVKNNITGTDAIMLPHGVCKVFEEEPGKMIKKGHSKKGVHLTVNDLDNDYQIYVYDSKASTKFQVSIPFTNGDNILTKASPTGSVSYYKITLEVVRHELDDRTCVQYPGSAGHQSFGECVEKENQRKAMPVLGCMPAWMSGKDQCNRKIPQTAATTNFSLRLASLVSGSKNGLHYESEACRLPCSHILVKAKHLNTKFGNKGKSHHILLIFEDNVKIKRVVLAYGFTSFLVEVGSSLGLWLGLSVVALFDLLVLDLKKIRKCYQQAMILMTYK